jgi:predicted nucleotidyltransferase
MAALAYFPSLHDSLRGALADVPGVEFALVFGSFARDAARAESDIDLIVVGSITLREVVHHLHGLQLQLDREINPHVYTWQEFRMRLARGDHFLTTVLSEPLLFVVGARHELEAWADNGWLDQPYPDLRPGRRS